MAVQKLVAVNHTRFIDPYANLFLDDVANLQIAYATNTKDRSAIVEGFNIIVTGPNTLSISKGIGIIGNIVFETEDFPVELKDTSYVAGQVNFAIFTYEYSLVFNPTKVHFDIVSELPVDTQYIIIGFIDIDNAGNIVSVLYEHDGYTRTEPFMAQMLSFLGDNTGIINSDLDMNNNRITNLQDPIDETDACNLETFNQYKTDCNDGVKILNKNDKCDYLYMKLETNDKMQMIVNPDHTISFNARDDECKVVSADSGNSFLCKETVT